MRQNKHMENEKSPFIDPSQTPPVTKSEETDSDDEEE